ncbi:hypothetical protein C900_00930 [Fulvivirga imtechensis AK7]|uniref:Uncharacterized protein n=1 Tax=Fulvivirga imtechensis AK7 TaxID=1237149 RepID=L8JH14_9BACT|nr:hypothetical protein C900_00930 [Fulvivirga imtechensis AK7]
MGAAVGTEAVAALRFVIHLQARGFVIVEGTVQHAVFVRLQVVVIQYLC